MLTAKAKISWAFFPSTVELKKLIPTMLNMLNTIMPITKKNRMPDLCPPDLMFQPVLKDKVSMFKNGAKIQIF
jgi:hypothetical protein